MKKKHIKQKSIFLKKKIYILSDCFIPTRNSASGMIYNLSKSLMKDGALVTCIHSGKNPNNNAVVFKDYDLEGLNFITSNLFTSFRNKNVFYRFVFETGLSISLTLKLLFLFKKVKKVDLIIWYGPSAFLWLPAFFVKLISRSPLYYILRDIFPDWLLSIGLVRNKVLYHLLNFLTYPQYIIPDKIGIETEKNLPLILKKVHRKKCVEVLYNWPSIYEIKNKMLKNNIQTCITKISKSKKNKQIIGIYTGNLGNAQDSENILNFLNNQKINNIIKIFFYSPKQYNNLYLNTSFKFKKAVPEYELPALFEISDFGLVSLNKNLISHNIPGKFVSYTQFGLPILCFCNKNSKLAKLIIKYKCGIVIDYEDDQKLNFKKLVAFYNEIKIKNNNYSQNSQKLFEKYFDLEKVKTKLIKII